MTHYPPQSGTWTWSLNGDGDGKHPPADAYAALQGLLMAEQPGADFTVLDWFLEAAEHRDDGTEQTAVVTVRRGEVVETLQGCLRITLERSATGGRVHWSFRAIGTRSAPPAEPCIPAAKSYPCRW